jgi:asparagine synthase (glutamine-hydrolysing)
MAMLSQLNGDFAIAIWDRPRRKLCLARDRFGVRPLFFAVTDRTFVFASEIKGLLAHPAMHRSLDLEGLDQFFTFWCPVGRRTLFSDISQLEPGHYLTLTPGGLPEIIRYWHVPVPGEHADGSTQADFAQRLRESVRIRLSGDLQNGVYLSGGLDSAVLAYLAQDSGAKRIKTFSIAFDDSSVDESSFQRRLASWLGTDHHELLCTPAKIGDAFPDVIRHAEAPLPRMAPVPMYLLSEVVRDNGTKIVLTGEGADEFLFGYDWYRAALVNQFIANADYPRSTADLKSRVMSTAPLALSGLGHDDILEWWPTLETQHQRPDAMFGVHRFRWDNMAKFKSYFSPEVKSITDDYDAIGNLRASLPGDFLTQDVLGRAQYLDVHTLLGGYLLSTQGDRMAMAHSVESRVPFLDHTLVEFLALMPATEKIVGFKEKWPLRQAFSEVLPPDVIARSKQSYTAPALTAFFGETARQEYAMTLMDKQKIASVGIFDAAKVGELVRRCEAQGFRENQFVSAFVSILSTQMLCHLFFDSSYVADETARGFRFFDRLSSSYEDEPGPARQL